MSMHLHRDMQDLHSNVLSMCAQVEEVVHKAVDGISELNPELHRELTEREQEIDRWDVRIEEDCLKILALHQPVATDLRRIVMVLKISGELERVADLGVSIAERAANLAAGPRVAVPEKLNRMAREALAMLRRSIDAFVELDCQLAREVCATDNVVDELNREIIEELQAIMQETPHLVAPLMQMFSASRQVERVADHATNIAEDVVYLVEGKIIRHRADY